MLRIPIISLILISSLLPASKLFADEIPVQKYDQSIHKHYRVSMDDEILFIFSDFSNISKDTKNYSTIHRFISDSKVHKTFKAPQLSNDFITTLTHANFKSDIRSLTDNGPLSIEIPYMTNSKDIGVMVFNKCMKIKDGRSISCRNRMRKIEIRTDYYEEFGKITKDNEPAYLIIELKSDLYLNDPLVGVTNYIIKDGQMLMTDELEIGDWCGTM